MTTPTFNQIALAGAAAEGSGALTGWNGLGSLSRAAIIEVLEEADLPTEWAPNAKSAIGHAGNAVGALKNLGFFTRRARGAKWEKFSSLTDAKREYRARWIVAVNLAKGANVGDAAGKVVLTIELRDGSDELFVDGDTQLAERVSTDYTIARDSELFKAGDITSWLSSTLVSRCRAARYAMGYYVPAAGREVASRLINALSSRWGTNWASPLLPVATSTELKIGIARGFYDEVRGVARSLQAAREAARKDKKADISPAIAARLLRDLLDVDTRAAAYRVIVGEEALQDAIAEMVTLREVLAPIADDSSQRFAMLELDVAPSAQVVEAPQASPAERAADKAAEKVRQTEPGVEGFRTNYRRLQELSGMDTKEFRAACDRALEKCPEPTPSDWIGAAELVVARQRTATTTTEPELEEPEAPKAAPAPKADETRMADTDARFGLLELN